MRKEEERVEIEIREFKEVGQIEVVPFYKSVTC